MARISTFAVYDEITASKSSSDLYYRRCLQSNMAETRFTQMYLLSMYIDRSVEGLVTYVVVARHTNQDIGSSIREHSEEEKKNEPSTLINCAVAPTFFRRYKRSD